VGNYFELSETIKNSGRDYRGDYRGDHYKIELINQFLSII
jgi:hypothetical protein